MSIGEPGNTAPNPYPMTDLYFVGGVPIDISQSDLLNFFSKFTSVDALVLRSSKSPSSKGFAFLRTREPCDLMVMIGNQPNVMGHILSLEPAEDPKEKMLASENRSRRKIFIGAIPQKITSDQVVAVIQAVGPIEMLTRIRSKSDRTKYCYAIMQHLEHAEQLIQMKRLKVLDPVSNRTIAVLNIGHSIPNNNKRVEFLTSKCQALPQKTSGNWEFYEQFSVFRSNNDLNPLQPLSESKHEPRSGYGETDSAGLQFWSKKKATHQQHTGQLMELSSR